MISNESRYRTCILYKDGMEEFLGARQPIESTPRPDDRFHSLHHFTVYTDSRAFPEIISICLP